MPETLKTTSRIDPPTEENVEAVEEERPVLSEAIVANFGSGGDTFQDSSESLYK
jgi:hypothetical protein